MDAGAVVITRVINLNSLWNSSEVDNDERREKLID